jgi:hypothetical protein
MTMMRFVAFAAGSASSSRRIHDVVVAMRHQRHFDLKNSIQLNSVQCRATTHSHDDDSYEE